MNQYEKMMRTPIAKLVSSLALPAIISMLITSIYNLADTFFVSQLGDSQSAAISVVYSFQALIQSIAYTIGMGAGSMISRNLGKKNETLANVHASQGFFMSLFLGIIFLIFGLLFRGKLVYWIGSSETSAPYVYSYLLWIIIAAPFMMASFTMNNILRSEGHALFSMIGLGIGGILNIGLDPLLINVFSLGIAGAGIATMISQIVSFSLLLGFFLLKKSAVTISIYSIGKDFSTYLDGFRCGVPTLFRQGFGATSNILFSFLAMPYGDAVVAAIGITNKIYMICRNFVIGFGQGFQPVLGYGYGAKEYSRIRKAFLFTLGMQTGFCLIATLIVGVFPAQLVSFFRDSEEVIRVGSISTRFLMISLPFLGFSTITNQAYQIIGYSKSATFMASCRQGIVFTPLILILNALFQEMGICLNQPLSDFITALISLPFFIYFFKLLSKLEKGKEAS